MFECLRHIALRHNKTVQGEPLLSQLPVGEDGITPDLFPLVASRLGFDSKLVKTDFARLFNHTGPIVVVLNGHQLGVVYSSGDMVTSECFLVDAEGKCKKSDATTLKNKYAGFAFNLSAAKNQSASDALGIPDKVKTGQWFWNTLWRYRSYYIQIIPAALLVNLFALAMPFFVMIVYDKVVPNYAVETLWVLALGVVLVYLFDLTIRLVRGALLERAGRELDFELGGALFEQVMSLSMKSVPHSSGVLANRVKAYDTLREFFVSAAMLTLSDFPFAVLMIGVVFFVAGPIGWVLLLAVAIGFFINLALQLPLRSAVRDAAASSIERQALIGESIVNLESVKASNAEGFLQRRMSVLLTSSALSGVKSHWYTLVGNSATTTLVNLTSVAVVVAGVFRVQDGLLSMGGLIATVMLTSRCMAPLAMLSGLMTRLQQTLSSLESLNGVMDLDREIEHDRQYIGVEDFSPSYEFKNVTLQYADQAAPALSIDDLQISPNECVAVLGKIQESALFQGTLRDNIRLGQAQVTDAKIMQALSRVGLGEFIQRHPHGLNAEVGERGALLSGGQRRAVSICRCLVRDYKTLLLDEPTANLDPQTEQAVIGLLRELKLGQASMVIATHKASVLSLVDRAIVIEDGQIVADGPPDQVLGTPKPKGKPQVTVKTQKKQVTA